MAPRAGRGDVFSSAVTGLAGDNSKTSCDVWQPEVTQGQFVHENTFSSRGVVRRIVTQEPRDAMRKGFTINVLDQEDQKALAAFNQRRQFNAKFTLMREWARKYGGAGIFMDIDDGQKDSDGKQDTSKPVRFESITRLGQLTVMDRWELEATKFEHDLSAGQMYRPTEYRIVNLQGKVVHPSRLLIMQGIELTPREQSMTMGWGASVIDAVWKALRDYLTTHSYLAEAVTRNTQGILTMPALEGAMSGCENEKAAERMESLSFWMSAIGDIALTKDETYEVVQRGMTGLPEVARTFFEQLVVDTEIPMTILGGTSPGGLNTGANAGEWQSWTSYLGGVQTRWYNPPIRKYHDVVFRAANTPIASMPEDWDVEWSELFEPNITEFSGAVAAIANAGVLLEQARMYSAEEIRQNALLAKAFPHLPETKVSNEIRVPVDEPEEEELSVEAGDALAAE